MTYQLFLILFDFFHLHCIRLKLECKQVLETSLVKNILVRFLDQENVLKDNKGFQTWLQHNLYNKRIFDVNFVDSL